MTTDGGDDTVNDLWESVPEVAQFHYLVQFEDELEPLDTVKELQPDEEIEWHVGWIVAQSIGPPDADGVRTVTARRVHPNPND